MSKQDDNVPLGVKCESGRLVIEIGIRTLAYAVAAAPWAAPFDEAADDYIRTFAITDHDRFAAEVRLALLAEDEGGSTLVTDLIDRAAKSAINDGCAGIDWFTAYTPCHWTKGEIEYTTDCGQVAFPVSKTPDGKCNGCGRQIVVSVPASSADEVF